MKRVDTQSIGLESAIYEILRDLGEDPTRKGLLETPARVSKSLRELTAGYEMDPEELLSSAVFEEPYDEMIIVNDIDFFSLCEHHMLPFYGKASVAYIPNGKIVGLSKIPRVVEVYSRRLQVQERMTEEIANSLQTHLNPKGVAVIVKGYHLCMMMRGVKKQNSLTVTSSMKGSFKTDIRTRQEFLSLADKGHTSL